MEELIARIEESFYGVQYPGDDHLTNSTYGEEPVALVKEFRGKNNWSSLLPEFLDQAPSGWSSALSFFSSEAFQFYIPAYIRADIKGKLFTVDPAFSLCSAVTPAAFSEKIAKVWGGGTMGEWGCQMFSLFNSNQEIVVVEYLLWKLDKLGGYDPTIEQGLENYWLKRTLESS